MSDESNKQKVLDMHAAIGRGDLEGMFADMTEDVTFRVIGRNHRVGQRIYQGKEDIVNNLLMTVLPCIEGGGVQIDITGIGAGDDKVFLQFSGSANMRSGELYENDYVQVFDFRDGRICGVTEYLDTALLARLLGDA